MNEGKQNLWGSHSFWMILCCLIPIVAIGVLSSLGILGTWGLYLLILLCPLLHFIFMRWMVNRDADSEHPGNGMMSGK
jgi:uncharacterized membrane protein YhaH (DUF805 family)